MSELVRENVTASPDRLLGGLRTHFGFAEFRPLQRETIEHLLGGGDALVLMPTGGGKSLCYQLPALIGDGLTLGRLAADRTDAGSGAGAARQRRAPPPFSIARFRRRRPFA